MILYLIYGFGMVTCTVSPLSRFTAHLFPVRLTNERVGVFLARRSVQHLVSITNFRAGENCKLSLIRNKNRNYNYFLFTLLQEKNEMSANDI